MGAHCSLILRKLDSTTTCKFKQRYLYKYKTWLHNYSGMSRINILRMKTACERRCTQLISMIKISQRRAVIAFKLLLLLSLYLYLKKVLKSRFHKKKCQNLKISMQISNIYAFWFFKKFHNWILSGKSYKRMI